MAHRFAVPEHPLTLRTDSATLAAGKRLATVRGCVDCHGANLGGSVMFDDPALGRLAAPNLTLGGRGKELEPRDWERAIRHGVRRDGTSLRVMPAQEFTTMADDELAAIVSYIRSRASGRGDDAPRRASVRSSSALYAAGQVKLLPGEEIDHTKSHARTSSRSRRRSTASTSRSAVPAVMARRCRAERFPVGRPDWKPAANITPAGIGRYSEADFVRVLREGKRPDGSAVDS